MGQRAERCQAVGFGLYRYLCVCMLFSIQECVNLFKTHIVRGDEDTALNVCSCSGKPSLPSAVLFFASWQLISPGCVRFNLDR